MAPGNLTAALELFTDLLVARHGRSRFRNVTGSGVLVRGVMKHTLPACGSESGDDAEHLKPAARHEIVGLELFMVVMLLRIDSWKQTG